MKFLVDDLCLSQATLSHTFLDIVSNILMNLYIPKQKSSDDAKKPSFVFTWLRYSMMFSSLLYNIVRYGFQINESSIEQFLSLARILGSLIQIIFHYIICRYYYECFYLEKLRVVLWTLVAFTTSALYFVHIFRHSSIHLKCICAALVFNYIFWYFLARRREGGLHMNGPDMQLKSFLVTSVCYFYWVSLDPSGYNIFNAVLCSIIPMFLIYLKIKVGKSKRAASEKVHVSVIVEDRANDVSDKVQQIQIQLSKGTIANTDLQQVRNDKIDQGKLEFKDDIHQSSSKKMGNGGAGMESRNPSKRSFFNISQISQSDPHIIVSRANSGVPVTTPSSLHGTRYHVNGKDTPENPPAPLISSWSSSLSAMWINLTCRGCISTKPFLSSKSATTARVKGGDVDGGKVDEAVVSSPSFKADVHRPSLTWSSAIEKKLHFIYVTMDRMLAIIVEVLFWYLLVVLAEDLLLIWHPDVQWCDPFPDEPLRASQAFVDTLT